MCCAGGAAGRIARPLTGPRQRSSTGSTSGAPRGSGPGHSRRYRLAPTGPDDLSIDTGSHAPFNGWRKSGAQVQAIHSRQATSQQSADWGCSPGEPTTRIHALKDARGRAVVFILSRATLPTSRLRRDCSACCPLRDTCWPTRAMTQTACKCRPAATAANVARPRLRQKSPDRDCGKCCRSLDPTTQNPFPPTKKPTPGETSSNARSAVSRIGAASRYATTSSPKASATVAVAAVLLWWTKLSLDPGAPGDVAQTDLCRQDRHVPNERSVSTGFWGRIAETPRGRSDLKRRGQSENAPIRDLLTRYGAIAGHAGCPASPVQSEFTIQRH